MKHPIHGLAALALAAALPLGAAALAQEGGAPAAPPAKKGAEPDDGIRRTEKARRLLKASNWLEQTKGAITARVEEQEKRGALPAGASARFLDVVDWNELLDLAVASYVKNVDEDAMDAAIVFYESPEGQKFAKHQPQMVRAGALATSEFVDRTSQKAVAALAGGGIKDKAKGLWDKVRGGKESNEAAAIATLRKIVTGQAHIQTSGKIDVDNDGFGEHGTLMEMSRAVKYRGAHFPATASTEAGSDWSVLSSITNQPDALPSELGRIDERGIVESKGYLFIVYLPGANRENAGFVHEAGSAKSPRIEGDGKLVGIDLSERTWCAYAWPVEKGKTGDKAFFTTYRYGTDNMTLEADGGEVFQSGNEKAQWSGKAKFPPAKSAYRGDSPLSPVAVGTVGMDGDVWTITPPEEK